MKGSEDIFLNSFTFSSIRFLGFTSWNLTAWLSLMLWTSSSWQRIITDSLGCELLFILFFLIFWISILFSILYLAGKRELIFFSFTLSAARRNPEIIFLVLLVKAHILLVSSSNGYPKLQEMCSRTARKWMNVGEVNNLASAVLLSKSKKGMIHQMEDCFFIINIGSSLFINPNDPFLRNERWVQRCD